VATRPPVKNDFQVQPQKKGDKLTYDTPAVEQQRERVKDMMRTAWSGYREYAWGYNELSPVKKAGHSAGIFGKTKMVNEKKKLKKTPGGKNIFVRACPF
jgi:hypothetical protein